MGCERLADAVERLAMEHRPERVAAATLEAAVGLTHAVGGRLMATTADGGDASVLAETDSLGGPPPEIAVQIQVAGRPWGRVELWGTQADPDAVAQVRVLGALCAVRLQAADEGRRAADHRRRTRRVATAGRSLRRVADPQEAMALALSEARALTGAPAALLTAADGADAEGAVCQGTAAVGRAELADLLPAAIRPAVAEGSTWSGALDPASIVRQRGFRTVAAAGTGPHSGIGYLAVLTHDAAPLDQDELDALSELAGHVGTALGISLLRGQLADLGAIDPLTRFFNERYFLNRLEQECQRAGRSGGQVSVVILSLDGLADLRADGRGGEGDAAVHALGAHMAGRLRAMDVGCRVGQDELAAILPDVAGLDALRVGERLRTTLGQSATLSGTFTLSVGVASFPDQAGSPESLYANGRRAMRWARLNGGDRTFLYHRDAASILDAQDRRESRDAEAIHGTLIGLADGIDALHPLTVGHSINVGRLSHLLAAEVGLLPGHADRVGRAGRLHDVGKAGLPREIVAAPGPLDADRRLELDRHAERGERMVLASDLHDLAPWIRHHHEHYDGSGRPDGLEGDQIPLESRIIAVANRFDRLTSGGPGRAPRSPERSLSDMRALCGRELDGALVDALAALINAGIDRVAQLDGTG